MVHILHISDFSSARRKSPSAGRYSPTRAEHALHIFITGISFNKSRTTGTSKGRDDNEQLRREGNTTIRKIQEL